MPQQLYVLVWWNWLLWRYFLDVNSQKHLMLFGKLPRSSTISQGGDLLQESATKKYNRFLNFKEKYLKEFQYKRNVFFKSLL